jgi:NADPH:quinone reductase-like Zn-dependent oxidoreductase
MGPLRRAAAVHEFVCQCLRILPTRQDRAELATLTAFIEDAKLTPILDRIYPLAETDEGLRHVETGQPAARSSSPWHETSAGSAVAAHRC